MSHENEHTIDGSLEFIIETAFQKKDFLDKICEAISQSQVISSSLDLPFCR